MYYKDIVFRDINSHAELVLRAWNVNGELLITEDQKDHFNVIFDYVNAEPVLGESYNEFTLTRTPDGFYKIEEVI